MTYTYFTEFYKKICEILSVNTGMPSQAFSLSSNCESDIVRIKAYLNEIIGSKWYESGATIIRNSIVNQISKNVGEVNKFIKNNLEKAAAISINKLLPELKDMKTKDELLYKNKADLESMKSSLATLQNNMPSKYEPDDNGIKNIRDQYTAAVNKINGLIQDINNLSGTIRDQIQALNTLKGVVDGYIMEISTLGNENIAIPMMTLPSESSLNDLPLLDLPAETELLQEFTGGTFEKVQINGVGCRIYIPNGYVVTPDTKLIVYLTGSGDRGKYFSDLSENSDYSSVKSFPKSPVLVVVTDSFKSKNHQIYNVGNDAKLDSIISQAKTSMNITNPKISIVAYSLGNDLFAKYITGYGSTVDKAVLINPCGNALGHLTKPEFLTPYSNVGEVQIIQADRETAKHIRAGCYTLSDKLAESSNTSKVYFSGDHGDYGAVLTSNYSPLEDVSRQLKKLSVNPDSYIDISFNAWDFIDSSG